MKKLNRVILALSIVCLTQAQATENRAMAPGMWHNLRTGEPIADTHISQGAYIVLDNDGKGKASFQIALVPGDDVMQSLIAFQKTTGITSGKGVAVFNIGDIELDQWTKPGLGGPNHVPNSISEGREGLLVALFSGSTKGNPSSVPPPHVHAMVAGYDSLAPNQTYTGGYPATGGHLGKATVNVVLEMQVDSYPVVIEKEPRLP